MKLSSTEQTDTQRTSPPSPTGRSLRSTHQPGSTVSSGSPNGPSLPATSSQDSPPSQNSSLLSKRPSVPALSASAEQRAKLDLLLLGCFTVQKLYGRDPGSIEAVNHIFHSTLAKHPADHVIRAFELWLERSQEFPTPADIIGIIKRKGRPPLSRETYIAISKKDAELRDADDWQFLRDYEAEQRAEVSGFDDEVKTDATLRENIALRQQVKTLTTENARLAELLHQARVAKGLEPIMPSQADKVAATVKVMRAGGASEEDIAAFEASQGVAA